VPDPQLDCSARTGDPASFKTDCLIVPVFSGTALTPAAAAVDAATGGALTALRTAGDFTAKAGTTLVLHQPQGLAAGRLLLVGAGAPDPGPQARVELLAAAARAALATPARSAALLAGDLLPGQAPDQLGRLAGRLFTAAGYRYRPAENGKTGQLARLVLLCPARGPTAALNRGLALGRTIGAGLNSARRLGDLPGNLCTPGHLAEHARALGRRYPGLKVQVLDEPRLRRLKMGALLSVTAGTDQPGYLITLEYRGAARQAPVVLVGKGVTFDSGGISLKPGAKMDEMKYDMCGAASVLGVMEALAAAELPISVVGVIPAVENLPSGKATKPGDVVTSMSGKTIEILNTDAEGRLILCDALTYAARYQPEVVIDIATLTGACVVALGRQASGLFSNDDELAEALLAAGIQAGDRAWRLPLWKEYDEQLKSSFADLANVGGPEAGSVTAACFLARFAADYRWAHLDIAGTAWTSGAQKGASGRPVPLLMEYLLGHMGART
jgi:leucyl aminopeptidase